MAVQSHRSQHDHAQAGQALIGLRGTAELESIEIRHLHVDDRQIVVAPPVGGGGDPVGALVLPPEPQPLLQRRPGVLAMTHTTRGALMRPMSWLSVVVLGFWAWRVRRAAAQGDEVAGFVLTGITGCLVSPFTWVHHLVWLLSDYPADNVCQFLALHVGRMHPHILLEI